LWLYFPQQTDKQLSYQSYSLEQTRSNNGAKLQVHLKSCLSFVGHFL